MEEMKQKRTATPWRIEDRRKAPLPNVRILDSDNNEVAQLSGVHTRDRMQRWTQEQADTQDIVPITHAELIVRAVNSFDELVDALKAMIETRVRHSTHALHPSKRFCDQCGQNSETAVHVEGCPVGIAEAVIARAEQVEGEGG